MILRGVSLLLTGVFALSLAGCKTLNKKDKKDKKEESIRDFSHDTSFQGFRSRLSKAISKRDVDTLSGMMTINFGYSWEPGGEGPGVFAYWDRHKLWGEIEKTLAQGFAPHGDFMVAPAEVATNPDYDGYRAGVRIVNGSWRFAYFVSAPPAGAQEE